MHVFERVMPSKKNYQQGIWDELEGLFSGY